MNRGQVLMKLSNWKDKYDIDEGMKKLEETLKEQGLDYSNIEFILKYTRDDYGEISILTKPAKDIENIKFNKI